MAKAVADFEKLENAVRLFFQSVKGQQYWQRVVSLSDVKIDRPAAAILQTLNDSSNQTCRVQDLADRLGIEAPSVTRKTQELEAAGLIIRVHNPEDKRVTNLEITAEGRATARKIWQARRDLMSDALAGWSQTDKQLFVKLFERFSDDFSLAATKSKAGS